MAGYYTFLMGPQPKPDVIQMGGMAGPEGPEGRQPVSPNDTFLLELQAAREKQELALKRLKETLNKKFGEGTGNAAYYQIKRFSAGGSSGIEKGLQNFRREKEAEGNYSALKILDSNEFNSELSKVYDVTKNLESASARFETYRGQGVSQEDILRSGEEQAQRAVKRLQEQRFLSPEQREQKNILRRDIEESRLKRTEIGKLKAESAVGIPRYGPELPDVESGDMFKQRLEYYWPGNEFFVLSNERDKYAKQSNLVPELKKNGELTPVPDPATALMREVQNLPQPYKIPITMEFASLAEKSRQQKMAKAAGTGTENPDDPFAADARKAFVDDDPLQMVKDVLNRPSMKYQESIWFFVATALATGLEAAAKIWARDTSGSSMVAQFLKNTFEKQRRDQEKELDYKLKAYQLRSMAANREAKLKIQKQDLLFKQMQEANKVRRWVAERGDENEKKLFREYDAILDNVKVAADRGKNARTILNDWEATKEQKEAARTELEKANRNYVALLYEAQKFRDSKLHFFSRAMNEAQKEK